MNLSEQKTTTIKVTENVSKRLNNIKRKHNYKTINDTLLNILKMISKFKLENELYSVIKSNERGGKS